MQLSFGKFHGLLLVVLALLLFGLQAWLFTNARSDRPGAPAGSSGQERTGGTVVEHHQISKLPGVLGTASLLLGAAVFYVHRRQPPEQRG